MTDATMTRTAGQPTKIANIEKELGELWSQLATDDDTVTRATTLNLVIYTESVERAMQLASQVPASHPCRLIVLTIDPQMGDTLTAEPTVVCRPSFGREARSHVCGEQIVITTGREGLTRAAYAVQSLLIADNLTYLLWMAEFDLDHPLLEVLNELSGGLIVDSAQFADPEAGLRALGRYLTTPHFTSDLFDMNWERLKGFCLGVASAFEPVEDRSSLWKIRSVEIAHRDQRLAGMLIFGWLADRLGWKLTHGEAGQAWTAQSKAGIVNLSLVDTDHTIPGLWKISIGTDAATYVASFSEVDGCIHIEGGSIAHTKTAAPMQSSALLDTILSVTGPDRVYLHALQSAGLLAEETISAEVVVVENADVLAGFAARKFVTLAKAAIRANGRFTVALSGGSTPKALFALLAGPRFRNEVDWAHVHFFWGDERDVPLTDEQSNQKMARETLLTPLAIPEANIHGIAAGDLPARDAAAKYADDLRAFFGLAMGDLPTFDFVLLGMGDDGHTASLFPHSAGLNAPGDALVIANEVPQLQTTRLSFTFAVINHAAHILALVAGAKKADTIHAVLRGPYQPDVHPIQRIKPSAGGMYTLALDREAAA